MFSPSNYDRLALFFDFFMRVPAPFSLDFPTGRALGSHGASLNDGTNMRRVTVAPPGYVDFQPHFSPDGQHSAVGVAPGACWSRVFVSH